MKSTLDAYLHEIAQIPLLSADEEIVLGRHVQAWMEIKDRPALEQINLLDVQQGAAIEKEVGMSAAQEKRIARVGQRAFNRMLTANLRLVVNVAKKYTFLCKQLEMSDLISEGNLGLKRAVEKFDPEKGYKFSTYAYWWIRQSITRAMTQTDHTIRLPIHMHEKISKTRKFSQQFTESNGRTPTLKEISEHHEWDLDEIEHVFSLYRGCGSLDIQTCDGGASLIEAVVSNEQDSEERLERSLDSELSSQLVALMPGVLTDIEIEVINFRFPQTANTPTLTLNEIGERKGVSRERIRQIERRALNKLQCAVRKIRMPSLMEAV